LVLAASACHRVFDLETVGTGSGSGTMDSGPQCEMALDPNLDEDSDGTLNGMDACPRVANHDPNDEDGDGTPDACDLCPQIAGEAAAGDDPECDRIGAACDPDSTIVHDRVFLGFGTASGLDLQDSSVTSGQIRIVLDSNNSSGEAYRDGTYPASASYEIAGTITSATVMQYMSVALVLSQGADEYELMFVKSSSNSLRLEIEKEPGSVDLNSVAMGTVTSSDATFLIQASTTPTTLALSGRWGTTAAMVETTTLVIAPSWLGIEVYRDSDAATTEVRIDYLQYVTVRP
jgi:hypothetical protein